MVKYGSKNSPPSPKLKNDTSYSEWKNKLDMWHIVCSYRKKEQVIIVLLQSLNENKKAEKTVLRIKSHRFKC